MSALKAELAKAQAGIASLQALVSTLVNTDDSAAQGDHAPEGSKGKGKVRDDDTHYFDSYAVNGLFSDLQEKAQAEAAWQIFTKSCSRTRLVPFRMRASSCPTPNSSRARQ